MGTLNQELWCCRRTQDIETRIKEMIELLPLAALGHYIGMDFNGWCAIAHHLSKYSVQFRVQGSRFRGGGHALLQAYYC
jgi:hypothetical protein